MRDKQRIAHISEALYAAMITQGLGLKEIILVAAGILDKAIIETQSSSEDRTMESQSPAHEFKAG